MRDNVVKLDGYKKNREARRPRACVKRSAENDVVLGDLIAKNNAAPLKNPENSVRKYTVMGKGFSLDDDTVQCAMMLRDRFWDEGVRRAKTFEELYIAGMNWVFKDKLKEIGETDVRNVPWDKIKLWILTVGKPSQEEKSPGEVDVPEDGSFMEYRLLSLFGGYICQIIREVGIYY